MCYIGAAAKTAMCVGNAELRWRKAKALGARSLEADILPLGAGGAKVQRNRSTSEAVLSQWLDRCD